MRFILILAILFNVAFSKVEVAASYQYIEDITQQIGGDLVEVETLSKPKEDPHFVMARPSLIAKLRDADLLIINGGQLEIGWLPPLIKRANNPKIYDGGEGFLDLSHSIDMIDAQESVSRADGDVHPEGNPHFILDPYNVPIVAKAIADKLSQIDSANQTTYQANYEAFNKRWQDNLGSWEAKMKSFAGLKVVEYHKIFDYFIRRYQLDLLDTIEPIPGISPTSKHTMALIEMINAQKSPVVILHDVYHNHKAAQLIISKTGSKMISIPHDVGAIEGADSIESLFLKIIDLFVSATR